MLAYIEGYFHTSYEVVLDCTGCGVEGFFDEFPQATAVLDLVYLAELVADLLFRIEVPNVDSQTVVVDAVHITVSNIKLLYCIFERS